MELTQNGPEWDTKWNHTQISRENYTTIYTLNNLNTIVSQLLFAELHLLISSQ